MVVSGRGDDIWGLWAGEAWEVLIQEVGVMCYFGTCEVINNDHLSTSNHVLCFDVSLYLTITIYEL